MPPVGIALPGEDLLGERIHAGRGVAGADGSNNEGSGVEARLERFMQHPIPVSTSSCDKSRNGMIGRV